MTSLNVCHKVDIVACLVGTLCAGVLRGLNLLWTVSQMAQYTTWIIRGNGATAQMNYTHGHRRGGGLHLAGEWPSIFLMLFRHLKKLMRRIYICI